MTHNEDTAPEQRHPEQRHTATVIGGAKDFLAAARVLDRLDRFPVGESPVEATDRLATEHRARQEE